MTHTVSELGAMKLLGDWSLEFLDGSTFGKRWMSEEGEKYEEELNREIEEIVSRIESLSLTPAPRPPVK